MSTSENILGRGGFSRPSSPASASADDRSILDEVTIRPGSARTQRSVIVHMKAGSVDDAGDLALEVGKQTAGTSTFELVADARTQAGAIRRRLRLLLSQRPPKASAAAASAQQAARGSPFLSLGPNPVKVTESRKPVDRLLGAFPGELQSRPNPVVAGLAGLLLALSTCVLWLLVRRRLASIEPPAGSRT